ncbi:MAG: PorT family protein [Bacteroidales bacterium]|nr:PorT family protein [Bacteroidales bacterium]
MKIATILIIALTMIIPVTAQNDTVPALEEPSAEDMSFNTPDKTKISVGKNEIFIIEDNGDTTKFQLGSKGMSVVEGKDGYTINIVDMNDDKSAAKKEEKEQKERKSTKKFKPHYAGIELGMNNFMTPDYTLHTGSFMNLNTTRSWNWNLNFLEYGIGLGTSYAGLVTGMGLEFSNYVFDNHNSIEEVDGAIVNRPEPYTGITKSKLSMTYLTAPLLLEFQIPAGKKRIHISGGVTGGLKLGSKTKIKYNDGGKQKEVKKDDFSLAPFRYGATVRIGYRAINLFATYYFSPLFGETADPEIYPFSVGLNLLSF